MSYQVVIKGICGHEYNAICTCICDPFGGGMCDTCLDGPGDLCPECWKKDHPPRARWWLFGKVL